MRGAVMSLPAAASWLVVLLLTVPALQVQVSRITVHQSDTEAELKCHSSCGPAGRLSYVWFKNRQKVTGEETSSFKGRVYPGDIISCALKGHKNYGSPPVYAPKLPSVSVSPSAEIVEGSSVTLSCSTDANPAANYTWYKENEDSPKASGQIFTITDFRAEHSGNYYCEVQNRIGCHNSTLQLTISPRLWKSAVIGTTPVVILAIIGLALFFLIRAAKQSPQRGDEPDNRTQDDLHYASVHFSTSQTEPVYSNIRPAGHHRHKEGEEGGVEYAAVKFNSASAALRSRGPETAEDPSALYSTVNKRNC